MNRPHKRSGKAVGRAAREASALAHRTAREAAEVEDDAWADANPTSPILIRAAGEHEFCLPGVVPCHPTFPVPPGQVLIIRAERLVPGVWARRPLLASEFDQYVVGR